MSPLAPPQRYPQRVRNFSQLSDYVYSNYSSTFAVFLTSVHNFSEPSSYQESLIDPLWRQAMAKELYAPHKTYTWDIISIPPGNIQFALTRLKKALSVFKQAPRAWFEKFSIVIKSLGFHSSQHDSALFLRCTSKGLILISLYVDDMIITGDDAQGIADQFVTSPTSVHWATVLRILPYLRGTQFQSLLFSSSSSLELRAYSDADWAGDPTDQAEYCVMASTTAKIIWFRWLLGDMGVPLSDPTLMYCDNLSVIRIARHERTKHIEIDYHFTRHHFQLGLKNTGAARSRFSIAITKAHFRFQKEPSTIEPVSTQGTGTGHSEAQNMKIKDLQYLNSKEREQWRHLQASSLTLASEITSL
ncbi:retrovirus-related pol polyprotein from transposon tnt 1-94 [Phtheirospermum japonicum]|uniref:Retrovirus-related pol polyprotein from transposon tnt 1-94 n=1 Tax=Phtheirospermum japonicum TaxID=374723 RepID=A0A830B8Y6_9LAMI|nr:retrovirus-related pol polyprotein from transposon tnt 1-94 [Phtheirospermum japonicum]